MRRYLAAIAIVLLAMSAAHAGETKSAAGVWAGVIGDTTYTLRLKTTSIDRARTIEEVEGTLTVRSMRPSGVTTRTVPACGQLLFIDKDAVVLNFGEVGRRRDYAVGIYWSGYLELMLFSIRGGGSLDFQGATTFQLQPSTPPTSPR